MARKTSSGRRRSRRWARSSACLPRRCRRAPSAWTPSASGVTPATSGTTPWCAACCRPRRRRLPHAGGAHRAPVRGRWRQGGGIMSRDADAVIVGSGPNGLAAAVTLSAAGLRVHVIEGAATAGGGCQTRELTLPGFQHDVCAAGHPLALASPFFRRFDLAARGVEFGHPEVVFAHPLDGGRAAVVTRSVQQTAARLGPDAAAYRRLFGPLTAHAEALSDGLLSSMRWPPRHPGVLAAFARNGVRGASAVARRFRTPEARGLIAGISAHAMMPLTCPPTAGVGLMFGALAHAVGWPVVAGGSGRIADAMIEAIVAAGGQVETGRWVRSLDELPAAGAVLLDVPPRVQEFQIGADTVGERSLATSDDNRSEEQLQLVDQPGLDGLPGQVRTPHRHVMPGGRLQLPDHAGIEVPFYPCPGARHRLEGRREHDLFGCLPDAGELPDER